jgi:uncharacterized protein (TIGR02145 family)
LYNWYTVNTNKLCPRGWHIPADAEWRTLITYLGGESIAGDKLKEKGTTHWNSPNMGATNETNFTALPGGYRYTDGTFDDIGDTGYWWNSPAYSTDLAYYIYIWNFSNLFPFGFDSKKNGYSVRCIKD